MKTNKNKLTFRRIKYGFQVMLVALMLVTGHVSYARQRIATDYAQTNVSDTTLIPSKASPDKTQTLVKTYNAQSISSDNPFPNLKDFWEKGHMIKQIYFTDGNWTVLMKPKVYDCESQIYKICTYFPVEEITTHWNKGYDISMLDYYNGYWVLVMSMYSHERSQRWISCPYFPENEIKEAWKSGYRIADISSGNRIWVVVFDKK